MNILTVETITKSFGERKLLDGASFFLEEGEKAGIIGRNGAGKSTLLKLIAGKEEPDGGRIVTANHILVEYLPQHPVFSPEETVLQAALSGRRADMENVPVMESDVKAMLTRLGVTEFDAPCGMLSGGERKRLALVAALLAPAELLLLDEPTNHLDHRMADWLEETLKKRKGAVIMVTHDRYFLDSVTDRIIEIDGGKIYSYGSGYSGYLEKKAKREEDAAAGERKRQSLLRTELAWVMRGARARSTKQKARLERYEKLKATRAPVTDGRVQMDSVSSRLGKTTLEVSHLWKSAGDRTLIRDFSCIFLKGDRVGFIGPNGCGKTTLMKLLTGEYKPDAGSVVTGQTVKIGYFSQEPDREQFPSGKRVIDYIRDVAEYIKTEEGSISASQLLERFLFTGSEQYTPLDRLSGGEMRRLGLLRVLMSAPNVLLLDEPTNDLDIATLTVLEDYLDRFGGIVITVSHDRYFLDRTVRRIFAFEKDGSLRQYEGGYTDFSLRRQEENEERETTPEKGRTAGRLDAEPPAENKGRGLRQKKLKFTWQEQRDYETIEADMAGLEERLAQLEGQLLEASRDYVRLNELTQEKERTGKELEEKLERWMYLEELRERIDRQQESGGKHEKEDS